MKKANNQTKNKPARRYKFYLGSRERYIQISSDFDSGNIELIKQISQFQYRLGCVHDGTFTNHRANSKSWFYFSVSGFPKNTKGRFFVTKVQTLSSIYHSKYHKSYRPVFKSDDDGTWERVQGDVSLVMREDELEVVFDYVFRDQSEKVYFAFSYPFTFKDNIRYIQSLNQFICCDQFYFHREVIIKSLEGRDINLLTITSYDHPDTEKQCQQMFDEMLFPQRTRPKRFTKPVVLVSARVHPGETPSSFAMKGLVDFLTSKKDLRAKLLRKMFVFMIIPMINVDGVFHGHFRMDTEGKNLNRYYIKPNVNKQPAIYAIKQLASHLNDQNRLAFYFDLHAHNAKKGHFIYGNAINDFVEQVESQVFCKLVSMNNKGFEYKCCNFSQKHMNAKDKYQDLTKQGCGRVVMHRLAKIIHSYSVQCGIVSANTVNWLPNCSNTQFKLGDTGFQQDLYQDNKSKVNKSTEQGSPLFNIEMYQNLGKNLMVSILDVFDKNPYNRIYNSNYKSIDMLRRLTAFQVFHQDDRFRMFERFLFGKVKKINQLIKEVLTQKLHYKKLYNFYFCNDNELKNVVWPENIPGLIRIKAQSPSRIKRYRSRLIQSNQYIQSFKSILKGIQPSQVEITQEQLQQHECLSSQKSSQTDNCEEQVDQKSLNFEQELDKIQYQSAIKQFKSKKLQMLKQMSKIQLFCPCQVKHSKQTAETQSTPPLLPQEQTSKQQHIFIPKNSREAYLRSRSFKQGGCQTAKRQVDDNLRIFSPQKANLTPSCICEEAVVTRNQIKNSIHYTTKQESKIRIRKQFLINKSKGLRILIQSKIKGNSKVYSPLRIRQRLKSQACQRNSKLQLPLITSQIQALNSSVKLLTQSN